MATASSMTAVIDRIVALAGPALAAAGHDGGQVPVSYAWPGPSAKHEAVFCGYHPDVEANLVDATQAIAGIKANRKQRDEAYLLPVTAWVFRGDAGAVAGARTADVQAEQLHQLLEGIFADDPQLGLEGIIRHAIVVSWSRLLKPFDRGWMAVRTINVEVTARLT